MQGESMKIVAMIARLLLGLVFLVFGANKIVAFMPTGPLPTGAAGQFVAALASTKYLMFVGLCESVGGLLLLLNRFVPLGLTILGPVIVNILLAGLLMEHQAIPSGIVVTILWLIVFSRVRSNFAGLFEARAQS
jgi:putative oxidoreductase